MAPVMEAAANVSLAIQPVYMAACDSSVMWVDVEAPRAVCRKVAMHTIMTLNIDGWVVVRCFLPLEVRAGAVRLTFVAAPSGEVVWIVGSREVVCIAILVPFGSWRWEDLPLKVHCPPAFKSFCTESKLNGMVGHRRASLSMYLTSLLPLFR